MPQAVHRFGDFELDVAQFELRGAGRKVKLERIPLELLILLADNGGHLVSRPEIVERLWGKDVFVDTEHGINTAVRKVRAALGDDSDRPRFLFTVPGKGYRLLLDAPPSSAEPAPDVAVQIAADPISKPVARSAPTLSAPRRRAPRIALAAAIVAAIGIAALTTAWLMGRTWASTRAPIALESRTTTGDVYAPAISRDGAYLAYAWLAPDGSQGLRIRSAAGGNPIDLIPARPVQYWAIRFSARGDFVYYVAGDDGVDPRGTVFRVPSAGGAPERLIEHASSVAPSPDGRTLAFVRGGTAPEPTSLMLVGANGGDPHTLMTIDAPAVVQSIDWAPDSRTLLYVVKRREPAGDDRWHIGEIEIGGREPSVILPSRPTEIIAVAWLPNRRGFLMNAVDPESGLPQLWRVSYPDGAAIKLTDDAHTYKDLTITADGTRIVVQSLAHFTQLWTATGGDFHHATEIASGTLPGAYDDLAWMPGDRLMFRWAEHGSYDIWSMAADGGARRALTSLARDVSGMAMDAAGRFVFFASTKSGSPQIWRMRADGDDLRQLTHLRSANVWPIPSAGGRWIYFTADERGVPTLWRMTIDGDSLTEVIDRPVATVDLSPDGTQLAYSYRDPVTRQIKVAVALIDGKQPARSFDIHPAYALRWTPDGAGIAFTHPEGNVWVQPLNGSAPFPLTDPHPGFHTVAFAWSPGARYFAYTELANPVDAMMFRIQP